MARDYGEEYPERPLMGTLSDLLGIPHFTTSNGATVRKDFLLAVGGALGIPEQTLKGLRKDQVLAIVIETATRTPMDEGLYSAGATVTNEALQAILDGIASNGINGRPMPQDAVTPPLTDAELLAELDFDPSELKDERDRRLVDQAVREGQNRFRTALLEAYGGRCAVTGYDAPETLEAAHIYPYTGPAANRVSNGLLLRADIHRLFDRGAIAIDETNFQVLVKPHLQFSAYSDLGGGAGVLRVPRYWYHRPSVAALRSHREWAGM